MESLYFIAIVPPADIQDEITELKHEMASRFNSRHALNSPPHITLHMPFRWKDKRFGELHEVMRTLNKTLTSFSVQLDGFDFFEPRVVFVDVVENEMLHELQKRVVESCRKELKLDNANYKDRPFHPHVTIGFRDLKKPMFYEAKKVFELRDFNIEFQVDRIELLKHDGKRWRVHEF